MQFEFPGRRCYHMLYICITWRVWDDRRAARTAPGAMGKSGKSKGGSSIQKRRMTKKSKTRTQKRLEKFAEAKATTQAKAAGGAAAPAKPTAVAKARGFKRGDSKKSRQLHRKAFADSKKAAQKDAGASSAAGMDTSGG